MIAFSRITSTMASRTQVYAAIRVAEQTGDRAAQNHLLRFLDRAAWPMAIGGLVCAASFPAAVAVIATTPIGKPETSDTGRPDLSLTRMPETSLTETNSLTPTRKGISR